MKNKTTKQKLKKLEKKAMNNIKETERIILQISKLH